MNSTARAGKLENRTNDLWCSAYRSLWRKGLPTYDSASFPNRDQLTGLEAFVTLDSAGWPMNFQICSDCRTHSEVQAGIVCRQIAGLAQESLGLHFTAVMQQCPGSNRAAVALGAFELDFNPVVFSRSIIAQ